MAEQSLKDKTANGLFWGGVSNGMQQLLGMLFGIYLARTLNAEDYGLVGMLAIFSGIASTIQECGFTSALTNKQDIKHDDYNAVFWFSFLSSLVLYIILFYAAPFIALFYNKPELTKLSRVVFLAFLIGGVGVAHNAYLFKNLMVKERAKIDVLSIFISGATGISLALMGFKYWSLAIQSVMYLLVGTVLRWYYTPWRPSFRVDFTPLSSMIGFSLKLFLTNMFNQINNNLYSLILGRFYGAIDVGYYSQGQKWMVMGHSFVGGMINNVAQPILVQVTNDVDRQRSVFRKMLRFGAFISFPLLLGLGFVSKEFIAITLGDKWLPASPFLQLFCIWGSVGFMWTLYTNLLISYGKSALYMYGMIITGCLQVLFAFLMYPFGVIPMVFSYISVFFVTLFVWHLYAYRLIGITILMLAKDIMPFLLVTIASFAASYMFSYRLENIYLIFISKIVVSALFYTIVLWFSGSVVFKESLRFVLNKLSL